MTDWEKQKRYADMLDSLRGTTNTGANGCLGLFALILLGIFFSIVFVGCAASVALLGG
jgi:hypothetical protein